MLESRINKRFQLFQYRFVPPFVPPFWFCYPVFSAFIALAVRSWPAPDFFRVVAYFQQAGTGQGFECTPPPLGAKPHGWHRSGQVSTPAAGAGHRATARARPAPARHRACKGKRSRSRAPAKQAARVASIRAGWHPAPSTQPLALALATRHRTGKASTCKAPGRTGQAGRIDPGTGRHRTRSKARHPSPLSITRFCERREPAV
jgi:hypothetical protein